MTQVIRDAEGDSGVAPAQVVAARAALLDRLWPKDWSHRLSVPVPVRTNSLSELRDTMAAVIGAVAERHLSLSEGERLLGMVSKLADLDAALEVEKLRLELDEVRRIAEGGRRTIEGEIVPAWGRLRAEVVAEVGQKVDHED